MLSVQAQAQTGPSLARALHSLAVGEGVLCRDGTLDDVVADGSKVLTKSIREWSLGEKVVVLDGRDGDLLRALRECVSSVL